MVPVFIAIAVLVATAASLAFAQESSLGEPEMQPRKGWPGKGWLGRCVPGPGGFVLGYIKGKTDADLKTLLDALKNGKTLEDVASEYGLDLGILRDEVMANAPKAVLKGLDRETAVILSYIAKKADVGVGVLMDEHNGGKSLEEIAAARGLDVAAIKEEIATCLAGIKRNKNAWAVLCFISGRADADLKTLVEEYQNGKTLEDIAAEYGLELPAIEALIDAARPAAGPGGPKQGFGFGLGPLGRLARGIGLGPKSIQSPNP